MSPPENTLIKKCPCLISPLSWNEICAPDKDAQHEAKVESWVGDMPIPWLSLPIPTTRWSYWFIFGGQRSPANTHTHLCIIFTLCLQLLYMRWLKLITVFTFNSEIHSFKLGLNTHGQTKDCALQQAGLLSFHGSTLHALGMYFKGNECKENQQQTAGKWVSYGSSAGSQSPEQMCRQSALPEPGPCLNTPPTPAHQLETQSHFLIQIRKTCILNLH